VPAPPAAFADQIDRRCGPKFDRDQLDWDCDRSRRGRRSLVGRRRGAYPHVVIGQEFHADILEGALESADGGCIRRCRPISKLSITLAGTEAALANLLRAQLSNVRAERR
jgi:hypothetical protein